MKFKQFLYKYFIVIFSFILTAATIAVFASNAFSNELRNNLNNVWLEQSPDNSVNVVLEVNKAFASNPNLVKKDDRTYLLIMPSTDTSITRDIDVRGFEKYVSSLKVDYVKYNSSKQDGYTKVTIKAEPNVHFKVKSQFEKDNITKYPLVGAAFAGLLALFIFLGFRNFLKKPNANEQSAYADIAQENEQTGALESEEVRSLDIEEESQDEQPQEEAQQTVVEDEADSSLEDEDNLEEIIEETEISEDAEDILEEEIPEDVLDLFEEENESDIEAEPLDSSEVEEVSSLEDEDDLEEIIEETQVSEDAEDILEEEVPEDVLDLFEEENESDIEAQELGNLEVEEVNSSEVEEESQDEQLPEEQAEELDSLNAEDILEEEIPEDVLDLFEEANFEPEETVEIEQVEPQKTQDFDIMEETSDIQPTEESSLDFEEEKDSSISSLEVEEESQDEQFQNEDTDDIFSDIVLDAEDLEAHQLSNIEVDGAVEEFSDKELVEIVDGEAIEETGEDELDELFNILEEETILPENISDSADFVVEESFNNPFKADSIDIESFIGDDLGSSISSLESDEVSGLGVEDDVEKDPAFEPEEIIEIEEATEDILEEDIPENILDLFEEDESSLEVEEESQEEQAQKEDEQLGSLEAEENSGVEEEETIDTEGFFKNEPQEEVAVEEFFVSPSQEEITVEPEIEPEIEEIEKIEEVDDSEPLVLAQKEIDKDKMLYLIRHEGVFSLIGIKDDNVFVLHRFEEPVKTDEIIVKLNEQKNNQNIYIVKINHWRALIGVEQSAMELILEL